MSLVSLRRSFLHRVCFVFDVLCFSRRSRFAGLCSPLFFPPIQFVRGFKKLGGLGVGSTEFLNSMPFLRNPPMRFWVKQKFLGVFAGVIFWVPHMRKGPLTARKASSAAVESISFLGLLRLSGPGVESKFIIIKFLIHVTAL